MVIKIKNAYLAKLFAGEVVRGKPRYNTDTIVKFKKTILKLTNAESFRELASQKSLHFEALKCNLKGFHSVRVDIHYRLILSLEKDGTIDVTDVILVHDLSNHYQ
ncbi:type II toxin-antitoxin system RelE/ParE family toxin [Ferruginibacter sp. HRS2-29]|uniref:type II toxin-antitoxin system RelE/ParE family toxin n=1 Tax=Ferruginibacter sp. HRS2-29 TaxID=2487334 RepID=UPI0034E9377C|nr:hypothetical protein [Ferruginibacter sp. HRS2-29]